MNTNQDVFLNGDKITDWACDVDPDTGEHEPNGGVENLIEYKGGLYLIISSWDGGTILNPDSRAKRIKKMDFSTSDPRITEIISNW